MYSTLLRYYFNKVLYIIMDYTLLINDFLDFLD